MQWFLNLSTRNKLLLGFGLSTSLLAVIVVTGYWGMTQINKSAEGLYRINFANATDLWALRAHINSSRSALLTMLLVKEKAEQERSHQKIKEHSKKIDRIISELLDRNRNDPSMMATLRQIIQARDAFKETRDTQLIPHIYGGRTQDAAELVFKTQAERLQAVQTLSDELGDRADNNAKAAVQEAARVAQRINRLFLSVTAAALVVGIFLVLALSHSIAGPLQDITAVAGKVAVGDLAVKVAANQRRDEVGMLVQKFDLMVRNLQDMAAVAKQVTSGNLTIDPKPQSENDVLGQALSTMVANLRQVHRETQQAVNVLASSASEILAATSQVSSGAAETTTAVSETTTTVEEVKQTAQLSSQKAGAVAESAQKASQIAQSGRQSVDDAVAAMNLIQEQMHSLAENIVRLSEQSQAIGEIIATVNELAERSNLLAVNAAIEAAKAGEHGKGFAVVAQEVKSLAEQSKQATAQIRSILTDIQRAIGQAVMATEQGGKTVESGVKQSSEAGEAIRRLADSITESAQAALQIAASTQQQLAGVDQVAQAMENIKQASMQNLSGMKQAEESAKSLHDLGQKLKGLVESYTV